MPHQSHQVNKENYHKSNAEVCLNLEPSKRVLTAAQKLLKAMHRAERQRWGEVLLKQLNKLMSIDDIKLAVLADGDAKTVRQSAYSSQEYGYYEPEKNFITVQNVVPKLGTPLSAKLFMDTLLHEWIHHYDVQKLRIDSIHSKGFYQRLRDLKTKLLVN